MTPNRVFGGRTQTQLGIRQSRKGFGIGFRSAGGVGEQEFLGYASICTNKRYANVARRNVLAIHNLSTTFNTAITNSEKSFSV
jgi:hypothetical protein